MVDSAPQRRPFTGSCHCGETRYVIFLNLPHDPPEKLRIGQSLYRCNCTICHKTGFFHVRVDSSPDDFLLLSPNDPFTDLGDYQCDSKFIHFFFCRTCGVRCFSFAGKGEHVAVDLGAIGVGEGTVRAWRPKKDAWKEVRGDGGGYLSVNGQTLDSNQEGLDMREWYDKKWLYYFDLLEPTAVGSITYDGPYKGGTY